MPIPRPLFTILMLPLIALLLGRHAPIASAETVPPPPTAAAFDAAGATSVAESLAESITALRGTQKALPAKPAALQGAQAAFERDLQLLEASAQRLAAQLASGASENETYPLVRRIRALIRDASLNARRANPSESAPLAASLQRVAELEPFYESSTLPASPAPDGSLFQ